MPSVTLVGFVGFAGLCGAASQLAAAQVFSPPTHDRWYYPFNNGTGTEPQAALFGATLIPSFDDRDSEFVVAFDTNGAIPPGRGQARYRVTGVSLSVTVSSVTTSSVFYDPTFDPIQSHYASNDPERVDDTDPGRPLELFGAGFRNGQTPASFTETIPFGCPPFPVENCRSVFAADYDDAGVATDVSRQVRTKLLNEAWSVGQSSLTPGAVIVPDTEFTFTLDLCRPGVRAYVQRALDAGRVILVVTSLHAAQQSGGGGTGDYPRVYTKENPLGAGREARLEVDVRVYEGADFDANGQVDFFDYLDFAQAFGQDDPAADFNADCQVDFFDFLDFAAEFGR
ncbi:MAG: hypothetical protein SFZ23_07660 [Planctomycetota bacterium]|nr:hypothetical protein [Planctomycetota bacterium]